MRNLIGEAVYRRLFDEAGNELTLPISAPAGGLTLVGEVVLSAPATYMGVTGLDDTFAGLYFAEVLALSDNFGGGAFGMGFSDRSAYDANLFADFLSGGLYATNAVNPLSTNGTPSNSIVSNGTMYGQGADWGGYRAFLTLSHLNKVSRCHAVFGGAMGGGSNNGWYAGTSTVHRFQNLDATDGFGSLGVQIGSATNFAVGSRFKLWKG